MNAVSQLINCLFLINFKEGKGIFTVDKYGGPHLN